MSLCPFLELKKNFGHNIIDLISNKCMSHRGVRSKEAARGYNINITQPYGPKKSCHEFNSTQVMSHRGVKLCS